VLYPNDEAHRGKELRLKQQFFFTSCSLQDMLHVHALLGGWIPEESHGNVQKIAFDAENANRVVML
jgi:glycogen phosphorylase